MGAYEDFVKSIPKGERVPEPFASIDNRLDFLGPKIVSLVEKVVGLESAIGSIEGLDMTVKNIEQIPYVFNLAIPPAVGSRVMLTENAPFAGYIKSITPHWPNGCNALVDIRVGHGTKQFCPNENFLSLNNATPQYPFNEWVDDNEEIWVEMVNGDGGFTHAITVTIALEGIAV